MISANFSEAVNSAKEVKTTAKMTNFSIAAIMNSEAVKRPLSTPTNIGKNTFLYDV